MPTNDTLTTLNNHQSIRAYTDQPITDDTIATILRAATAGPSMNNYQPVTFIEVTDQALKQAITDLVGMHYIASATRYFVVAVDYHKLLVDASDEEQQLFAARLRQYANLEGATISAGIALGRAQVAAESLGLGTVTMAGPNQAFALYEKHLNLPQFVKPVMGFSIGYPDQNPGVKPKLPLSGFWMQGGYQEAQIITAVRQYNATMVDYYTQRGAKPQNWQAAAWGPLRASDALLPLTAYARQKGFNII